MGNNAITSFGPIRVIHKTLRAIGSQIQLLEHIRGYLLLTC